MKLPLPNYSFHKFIKSSGVHTIDLGQPTVQSLVSNAVGHQFQSGSVLHTGSGCTQHSPHLTEESQWLLGVKIVSVCEEAGGQLAQPADGDVAQPHKDTVRGGEGGGVVTEEGLQGRKAG